LKRWTRAKKEALIAGDITLLKRLRVRLDRGGRLDQRIRSAIFCSAMAMASRTGDEADRRRLLARNRHCVPARFVESPDSMIPM
jgi:hypothetical protein